jgi:hypothetical protein
VTARDSPDRESSVIEREPGFYWISLTNAHEVALWDGESWIVVGSALSVPDEEVTVLGQRLEPP